MVPWTQAVAFAEAPGADPCCPAPEDGSTTIGGGEDMMHVFVSGKYTCARADHEARQRHWRRHTHTIEDRFANVTVSHATASSQAHTCMLKTLRAPPYRSTQATAEQFAWSAL